MLLFCSLGLSQDCLDYPPIDGMECLGCAPDGWDEINTPDILDESGSWQLGGCILDLSGPPPGGGGISLFAATGTGAGYSEGFGNDH